MRSDLAGAIRSASVRARTPLAFFAATVVALAAGFVMPDPVRTVPWTAGALLGIAVSATTITASLRRGEAGVDVIALLALAGALAVGEALAAAVVACMLATGSLLEDRAQARARRELSLLEERAPRSARRREGGTTREVALDEVRRGDVLIVGPGEVVGVDGRLLTDGVVDESALTGEPLPVDHRSGDDVRSGSVNAGGPFDLMATAVAGDSTYTRIVRLVEQAQASSAPFVRFADRVAVAFVPLTLVLAGVAWWLEGDPVRAVAVLVVATPCPLLLAAPIAVMSGISRAAGVGAIVKGGGALERLARGRVVLFDKTGTLTCGRPQVAGAVTADGVAVEDLLRLAGGLDQVSPHVLADAIVRAARDRGLALSIPTDVVETSGHGIEGTVDGHLVRLGRAGWVLGAEQPRWLAQVRRRAWLDGSTVVWCSIDGRPAGALLLEDAVRPDAPRMVRTLRKAGLRRVVLVTGDRADVAEAVGRIVGVDAVHAEQDPEGKLAVLATERLQGPTVMVGDGVNDAPALAAADVGVALAARGTTASSQAADVVLTVDRVDALATAVRIARHARSVAVQSVWVGMGLCALAMLAAAAGRLAPTEGAVLQEVIDVLAIAVALRALVVPRLRSVRISPQDAELVHRIHGEHNGIAATVEEVRAVADRLAASLHTPSAEVLAQVRALLDHLRAEVVPHERTEEQLLYPVLARVLGGEDPTGPMSRAHAEIQHQVARLARLVDELEADAAADDAIDAGADPQLAPDARADVALEVQDVEDLQKLLYGLYAVLRLHRAQEEEGLFSLVPEPARG